MKSGNLLLTIFCWLCGLVFSAIGVVNLFWGNDPGFGAFIILLSLVFYPPLSTWFTKRTRFGLPWWLKGVVGLFILWSSLGVGELFDKIDLMLKSF
ncbi:hypothetical protein [Robiginitalea marina]|uniref:Uncharacterized protein n=1 Tax=Robiginitalea marina TaxID=2954105 RepID=A0ABT1B079_9FLAO|nr:hypothetical protein [Robiginitalea marina]MCO5725591.1 hypothetical protein [Robiginitalea marina]